MAEEKAKLTKLEHSCAGGGHKDQFMGGGSFNIATGQGVTAFQILYCKRCGMAMLRRFEIGGILTGRTVPVIAKGKN